MVIQFAKGYEGQSLKKIVGFCLKLYRNETFSSQPNSLKNIRAAVSGIKSWRSNTFLQSRLDDSLKISSQLMVCNNKNLPEEWCCAENNYHFLLTLLPLVEFNCGRTTSENATYFTNPPTSQRICNLMINRMNNEICQVGSNFFRWNPSLKRCTLMKINWAICKTNYDTTIASFFQSIEHIIMS